MRATFTAHRSSISKGPLQNPVGRTTPTFTILFGGFDSRLIHYARLRLRSGHIDRYFSRDETPDGSLPAFAEDYANPYLLHYKAAFAFSILVYPQPHQLVSRRAFLHRRATGLPRSVCIPARVRSDLSAGGTSSATGDA